MSGWVLSYRSKWTHPVFRNLQEAGVWSWLCDSAAWEDTTVRLGEHMFAIKRGQFVTSMRFVAKGFGLGERATRTLFENMEKAGMIDTQKTAQGTIITICNYEEYQTPPNANDTQAQTDPTNKRHTGDTNNETTKQPNKGKKEKTEVSRPANVSESVWNDFLGVRKAKRSGPLTRTAMDGIIREAEGIGWTLEQALRRCAEKSWASFDGSWVKEEKNGKTGNRHNAMLEGFGSAIARDA